MKDVDDIQNLNISYSAEILRKLLKSFNHLFVWKQSQNCNPLSVVFLFCDCFYNCELVGRTRRFLQSKFGLENLGFWRTFNELRDARTEAEHFCVSNARSSRFCQISVSSFWGFRKSQKILKRAKLCGGGMFSKFFLKLIHGCDEVSNWVHCGEIPRGLITLVILTKSYQHGWNVNVQLLLLTAKVWSMDNNSTVLIRFAAHSVCKSTLWWCF